MSSLKQKNTQGARPDVMKMIATGIVNARFVIIAVFAIVGVYCVLSIGKVKVNNDLTAFLPDTTQTRKGLTIMEKEFTTYATADVMISNITNQIAQELAARYEREGRGMRVLRLDDKLRDRLKLPRRGGIKE